MTAIEPRQSPRREPSSAGPDSGKRSTARGAATSPATPSAATQGPPRAGAGPALLVVADDGVSRDTLAARLELLGYRAYCAASGQQALELLQNREISLVLFEVDLPDLDGYELLEQRQADPRLAAIPFVVIAAPEDSTATARALEQGADDYVSRPFDPVLLRARVEACLDRRELRQLRSGGPGSAAGGQGSGAGGQASAVGGQGPESERIAQLRRFLSPQVVDLISTPGNEGALESHRREITVAFCDLRGYTAFSETAEPEDVMGVLRELHAAMGETIFEYQGTLERFTGDGAMIFFNDPIPVADHTAQAVRMAVALQARAAELAAGWLNRGYDLTLGMGIASGYATLGRIGFEGRFDYAAIGNVTNLAGRLCGEAAAGQILINRRVWTEVADMVEVEPVGRLTLKNIQRPVEAFNVLGLKGTTH